MQLYAAVMAIKTDQTDLQSALKLLTSSGQEFRLDVVDRLRLILRECPRRNVSEMSSHPYADPLHDVGMPSLRGLLWRPLWTPDYVIQHEGLRGCVLATYVRHHEVTPCFITCTTSHYCVSNIALLCHIQRAFSKRAPSQQAVSLVGAFACNEILVKAYMHTAAITSAVISLSTSGPPRAMQGLRSSRQGREHDLKAENCTIVPPSLLQFSRRRPYFLPKHRIGERVPL